MRPMSEKSTDDLFWEKVDTPDAMSCWNWKANIIQGYGYFGISAARSPDGVEKSFRAHRYAYVEIHGPVPEGLVIDHLCENKRCCNPIHLQAVTPSVNTFRHYRNRSACKHGHVFTPQNTGFGAKGERLCRTCRSKDQQAYIARKTSAQL